MVVTSGTCHYLLCPKWILPVGTLEFTSGHWGLLGAVIYKSEAHLLSFFFCTFDNRHPAINLNTRPVLRTTFKCYNLLSSVVVRLRYSKPVYGPFRLNSGIVLPIKENSTVEGSRIRAATNESHVLPVYIIVLVKMNNAYKPFVHRTRARQTEKMKRLKRYDTVFLHFTWNLHWLRRPRIWEIGHTVFLSGAIKWINCYF